MTRPFDSNREETQVESKLSRGIAALAAMAVSGLAAANQTVKSVTASKSGSGIQVLVEGEDLSKPNIRAIQHGRLYLVDFQGTLQGHSATIGVHELGLATINYAQHSATPALVRVVLKVKPGMTPHIAATETGWAIQFGITENITSNADSGTKFPNSIPPLQPVSLPKNATASTQPQPSEPQIAPALQGNASFPNQIPPLKKIAPPSKPATAASDSVTPDAKSGSAKHTGSWQDSSLWLDSQSTGTGTTQTIKADADKAPKNDHVIEAKTTSGTLQDATQNTTKATIFFPKGTKVNTIPKAQAMKGGIRIIKNPGALVTNIKSVNILADSASGRVSPAKSDAPAADAGPLVSLDFVNTEVSQIVKALAMESGANIVLSPDIAKDHQVTVALQGVSLTDALDLVTAAAGLTYFKMKGTYLVTTAANAAWVKNQFNPNPVLATRVVPIYSGSPAEIKTSVLSALSQQSDHAEYQVVLPGEPGNPIASATYSGGGPGGAGGSGGAAPAGGPGTPPAGGTGAPPAGGNGAPPAGGAGGQAGGASSGGSSGGSANPLSVGQVTGTIDQFVVVVGPEDGIDAAEAKVREIDERICKARGFEPSTDPTVLRDTYDVQSRDVSANALVDAMKPIISAKNINVDLFGTPESFATQRVVIVGRKNEVAKAEETLQSLDSSANGDITMVYDVKFADPRALREDVAAQVPGLRVSPAPASAGNPRIWVPGAITADKNSTQSGTQQQSGSGTSATATQANGSGSQSTAVKGDQGEVSGLEQPFDDFEPDAVPMKLVLQGTQQEVDAAMKYMQMVDVAPKQIALEMRVMELSKEDAEKAGIDWSILTGGAVKMIDLNQASTGGVGTLTSPQNSGKLHIGGRNWGADVTATLDQMANKNNLISRPNLLALDGRETEIFVGDVIRYVTSIQSTQTGTTVTTDSLPVGVRLAVLPRVSGDETITMDLRPVVSFLKSFTSVPGGGELPQTSVRISQSTVEIHDGDTIAIGGLIQDQDTRQVTKVPILGDLPIIGQLFRNTSTDRQRTEVVFFVTAHILTPENQKNAANPATNEKANPLEVGGGK